MRSPISEEESQALMTELKVRSLRLLQGTTGTVRISGEAYDVFINCERHDSGRHSYSLNVVLFDRRVTQEFVYVTRDHNAPPHWFPRSARDKCLPILRKHMVLDDLARVGTE